jgi:hypothetical protein
MTLHLMRRHQLSKNVRSTSQVLRTFLHLG